METNNNGGQAPQPSVVKPIWEAMGGQEDVVTNIAAPTPTNIQTEDVLNPPADEPLEPAKTETGEPAKETPAEPAKAEPTKEEIAASDDVLLELPDIKDVPTVHDESSWKGVASDLGFDIAEDTFEAVQQALKENFVPKAEAEKMANLSKETIFSTLKPEVATALELIEMGVPQELAFNPTKIQDDYLAMDSASLVRESLAAQKGWDEDMVDAKMEELVSDQDKLEVQAKIIRANLNQVKQEILQEQTQLVQKFTEQKQQESFRKQQEADNQFKEALAKESIFLGLKLSDKIKSDIIYKYSKGAYNDVLNPAQAKLRAILQLEYGDMFAKAVQSKAKEEGKAEIVRKLSDVPPKAAQGGSRVQVVSSDNHTENKSPFANIPIFTE